MAVELVPVVVSMLTQVVLTNVDLGQASQRYGALDVPIASKYARLSGTESPVTSEIERPEKITETSPGISVTAERDL
jgi:hypothetical protein